MKLKHPNKLKEIKVKLDNVSPSLCLAKWLQTTIYLNRGTTHSCPHCPTHGISTKQLNENPSSLSNTPIKMYNREEMLKGNFPAECDFVRQSDERKGTNACELFPELAHLF